MNITNSIPDIAVSRHHNQIGIHEKNSPMAAKITQARQTGERLDPPLAAINRGRTLHQNLQGQKSVTLAGNKMSVSDKPLMTDIMKQREQLLQLRESVAATLHAQKSYLPMPSQLPANNYAMDFAQIQELADDINAMPRSPDAANQLYRAILVEEFRMQREVFTQHHRIKHELPELSSKQYASVKINVAEKKLAIIDFCLKVLRLHEQAEWVPPTENAIKVPKSLKMSVSADELLKNSLANMDQIPLFSSQNGVDPDSGLYHEQQYMMSGTCVLHSNNHYLASWAQRENKTFLPLSPRRLTLLLNGLACRRETALRELTTMNLQRGMRPKKAALTATKSLLRSEVSLTDKKRQPLKIASEVYSGKNYTTASTGYLMSTNITTLMNELYGLPVRAASAKKSANDWVKDLDALKLLERHQNSLACNFRSHKEIYGHAIEFNKINGNWYLQDSHAVKPVLCTPSQFVKYLAKADNSRLAINNQGHLEEYRQHHNLTGSAVISFHIYQPQRT
nr:hypothetical protein [uncultured Enterobacter sp.]